MELKPGYKQTEVGVIPEDWDCVHIGDVAETSSGATPPRAKQQEYFDGGTIPWVKTLDLNNSSILETDECVTPSALQQTSLRLYPSGSVLVAMYGGFNQIGRTGMLAKDATINQALTAIRPDQSRLSSRFLLNYLNFRVEYWKSVASSSRKDPNITGKDVREFPIPLPPLIEQEAAGEALQDIEDQILMLDELIAKKRDIKQAAMQELLTGNRRLPGFEGEWEVKRLGDIGKCLRGVSYKGESDLMAYDTAMTKRLLRSNNIQGSSLTANDVKHVNSQRVAAHQIMTRGDILICMANGSKALVGKAGRFHINDGYEYTFGAFMGCFRTVAGLADPEFVSYLFQTGRYQHCVGDLLAGSSINNLKPSSIESLEFEFPNQTEQSAIAAVLSEMDAELAALEARRDKTRALKQAMMQELLTGRIRLR
jgi:type I restriction enzyme S subunit